MKAAWLNVGGLRSVVFVLSVVAALACTGVAVASAAPSIESESVSGVTSTNATLEAQIDTHESNVYYQFQLVANTGQYASEILCPQPPEPGPLCIGASSAGALPIGFLFEGETSASLNLSSAGVVLQPGATYHYRVLAAQAVQTEDTIEWEAPTVFGADQVFTTLPTLTLAKTGEGTVVSSPAGIECTGAKTGAECEHSFELNETVTLTASPAAGYAFSAWSGCLEHAGLTCKVTMDKAKTVKATFVKTWELTIEKAGTGSGKVAAAGISCDESCSKESSAVKTGTSVTVKTTPAKGNEAAVIEGGTGSASACSGSTCTFTIEANSSLKVKFNPIPSKTLTVKLTGPGAYKGKVSGKGTTVKGLVSTAILCGSGCTTETESFFSGGTTELTAMAAAGYTFKGWTVTGGSAGGCAGTTSPCTLATDANKTVEAKFE